MLLRWTMGVELVVVPNPGTEPEPPMTELRKQRQPLSERHRSSMSITQNHLNG